MHRELFSQPLQVAFVDLKAAFDSVDRLALWKALRGIGISQYLLHLIEDLHNGSISSIKITAMQTPSFITTSRVRQGCVLARLCSAVQLIGSWNVLSLPSASYWAMIISRIWITQMMLPFWLTPRTTSILLWTSLRQQRQNLVYMCPGRKQKSRTWVRVILTYLTYQSADTQWKKFPSSHIWALFCPPPVGANQIYSDGSALLLPPCIL